MSDIKYLFEPESICIIGASDKKNKIGYKIMENIKSGGYQGKVYPINPNLEEILGYKVYKNISDINEIDEIDIAVIAVPEPLVLNALKTCPSKKIKYVLVITSGFSEIGKNKEEKDLVDFAHQHNIRILGPNIFGHFVNKSNLNASFASGNIPKGNVALISQSGALGSALIGETGEENIGLSAIVPLGNKCDVDESDLIEYLKNDDSTKVILIYMEGVKNGEKLIPLLKETTMKKPVIIIKSGRSKKGAQAAASHTGSLSGSDEIFQSIMNQTGVHRPENVVQALQWAKFLANAPMPRGENTLIITNGGGVGVMAADACEKYGVHMYDNYNSLSEAFSQYVPEFGSVKNPIDVTGQVGIEGYEKCIEAAVNHPDIHAILCLGCEHALFQEEALKTTIEKIHNLYGHIKPIQYVFYGGKSIKNAARYLKAKGIPMYFDVYDAVSSLGELFKTYRYKQIRHQFESDDTKGIVINYAAISDILRGVENDKRQFLLANESRGLMEAAGISMPKSFVAKTVDEAIHYFNKINATVVMKIVSKDIVHKSDAGGVRLNIENEQELMNAWEVIMLNARKYNPQAVIRGIEICEQINLDTETIVGGRRDSSYGPMLMFGSGGIYVEILKDVAFRSNTFSKAEIHNMLKETKLYPLLLGVRGMGPKDIDAVVDVILRVALILKHFDQISDIEINPLVVYDKNCGARAVDARILIK